MASEKQKKKKILASGYPRFIFIEKINLALIYLRIGPPQNEKPPFSSFRKLMAAKKSFSERI